MPELHLPTDNGLTGIEEMYFQEYQTGLSGSKGQKEYLSQGAAGISPPLP
jgi:hypothetical protein